MTLDGSDKSSRATKVIKILERDFPNEFLKALKDEGHMTINSKTMNPAEVLAMDSDTNS